MRKIILLTILFVCLLAAYAHAEETSVYKNESDHLSEKTKKSLEHKHEYVDDYEEKTETKKVKAGVAANVNLIQFTDNTVGAIEIKKDLHQTNAKQGWDIWAIFKSDWILFDFTEKDE